MGKGIVSRRGQPAAIAFASAIRGFSDDLREPVAALLSGATVHTDAVLQIDAVGPRPGSTGTLGSPIDIILLRSGGAFKALLTVRPLALTGLLPDPRLPDSAPDCWRLRSSVSPAIVWELFNCEVRNVEPQHNRSAPERGDVSSGGE